MMPSAESKLTTFIVSFVTGCTADVPSKENTVEHIKMMTAIMTNSMTGSGSLLPYFSIPSKKRLNRPRLFVCFGEDSSFIMILLIEYDVIMYITYRTKIFICRRIWGMFSSSFTRQMYMRWKKYMSQ